MDACERSFGIEVTKSSQRHDRTYMKSGTQSTNGHGITSRSAERKTWMTTLETRFAEAEPNLSTSRKRLIREILDHPEDTYFLSSRALAKRYELDPTTIVRTVLLLLTNFTVYFPAT